MFRAETLPFRFPDWGGLRSQIAALGDRLKPDLIWADHMYALLLSPKDRPIVYGHLDFLYQLQPVRKTVHKRWLKRPDAIRTSSLKKVELDLCRATRFVVSVSQTDLEIFESIGVPSLYMPVIGGYIARRDVPPHNVPRAFLFGRSNTAMAKQRQNVREDIWPHLKNTTNLEYHLVGDEPSTKDETWRWFEQNFLRHGYVADLASVFAPGDLCLIPYKDDTGFRAKFVTAAAHGLVNIGYEETFRCATEFIPGENCLAARDGAHFAALLEQYASDPAMRARLANASRALYDEKFTLRALLPTYQHLLDVAMQGGGVHSSASG
jgi:hypothetical protein